MPRSNFRAYALGFLVPLCVFLLLAGSAAYFPVSATMRHITSAIDSFAFHFFAIAFGLAILIFLIGARWVAIALIVASAAMAQPVVRTHLTLTTPMATQVQPNLKLLWFNMLNENAVDIDIILNAISAADPDVLILAESGKIGENPTLLADMYPYRLGCIERCEVLVLSKLAFDAQSLTALGPLYSERLARVGLKTASGQPFTLMGVHMSKPWYIGLAETEDFRLRRRIQSVSGPQIVVGDFNAAPWSFRIRLAMRGTDLTGVRVPVSTWPVAFGRFGIPIDQVLVGGGVQVVSIAPWGHTLGSNHLGLNIALHVPPPVSQ